MTHFCGLECYQRFVVRDKKAGSIRDDGHLNFEAACDGAVFGTDFGNSRVEKWRPAIQHQGDSGE